MDLSITEFDNLREFIHDICGLAIPDEKKYLVQTRLEPIAKEAGCTSFGDFYRKIKHSCSPTMREQIITTMTTHETTFFRDGHCFDAFRDLILPNLAAAITERKRDSSSPRHVKARIWSAAASTGQEVYSIAMVIHEHLCANQQPHSATTEDFEILATDISAEVLTQAKRGLYSDIDVERGITQPLRDEYFQKDGSQWRVDERLQAMIEFRQVNLLNPLTALGSFDVIFCRNVLIYFDDTTKVAIFDQFARMLNDRGYLILGAIENSCQLTTHFESRRHGETLLYQKRQRTTASIL